MVCFALRLDLEVSCMVKVQYRSAKVSRVSDIVVDGRLKQMHRHVSAQSLRWRCPCGHGRESSQNIT